MRQSSNASNRPELKRTREQRENSDKQSPDFDQLKSL
jgi:hypothetical protein